ncbi:MAG: hypothetical protein CVV39_00795 [Planctomycetes bacterium HGW-Planctomycetes-1]|nr:MAG: hypothetical protein CVV39_00795 [Planctomycetes bacterium HGW-Planctomycetes-1]
MLAELIVIVVILATVGFIYVKGSTIKSFTLLMNALIGSTAALSFFETAGRLILGYGYGGEWVFGGTFIVIFVLVFLLLNVLAEKLAPENVHFGDFPDIAVRSFISIFTGLVIAGAVLIAAALMPIGTKLPYGRFNPQNKNLRPTQPDKGLILNADGFTASLASWFSRGSISGKKSLAVFHPDFINEIHLNRIGINKNNTIITGNQAVEVKAAWLAPAELVSASDNQPLSPPSGKKIVIVRTGISNRNIKDGGAMPESGTMSFTTSQIRLSCKANESANDLTGSAELAFPIGFIRKGNVVEIQNLTNEINLTSKDFSGGKKWYDFVFYISADSVPVMIQFKLNSAAQIGKLVSGDKIPVSL